GERALDVRERHGTPEPRVVALVAIVSHDEDVVGRHGVGSVVVAGGLGRCLPRGIWAVPRYAIDEDVPVTDLDGLSSHGHHALDEVFRGVLRPDEDHHVAGSRLANTWKPRDQSLAEGNP